MNAIYEKVLKLNVANYEMRLAQNQEMKDLVNEIRGVIEPDLDDIIKKLGIIDQENFKKSLVRNIVGQIETDADVACDLNINQEIVSLKEEIKGLTAKIAKFTL